METKKVLVCYGKDDTEIPDFRDLLQACGIQLVEILEQIESDVSSGEANVAIQKLKLAMSWADVLICYLAHDAQYPEAFELEIECAISQGKSIIGVWPQDGVDCPLPLALEKQGDALVGWDSGAIDKAINGERIWILSDGTHGDPRPLWRHPCK